jgi:tRNA-modifying protein YgfZ
MPLEPFLLKAGANIDAQITLDYGDPIAELDALKAKSGLYVHRHSPFSLKGEDVKRWCNGMLSNNIRKLNPFQGNRNAVCTSKGILEGLLYCYCIDPTEFICIPDGINATQFEQRFRQFLFLDDIELETIDTHCTLSLVGTLALEQIKAMGYPEIDNNTPLSSHNTYGWCALNNRFGLSGVDLICPRDQVEQLIQSLQARGASLVGHLALEHARIQSCQAAWPIDRYSEKPLLHALRLNIDCCAFDKGCYVGQEVINRIDVKGKLGRKLQLVCLDKQVQSGTLLLNGEREIAPITSVSSLGDEILGLAVLPKAYWEAGSVLAVKGHPALTATVITPQT